RSDAPEISHRPRSLRAWHQNARRGRRRFARAGRPDGLSGAGDQVAALLWLTIINFRVPAFRPACMIRVNETLRIVFRRPDADRRLWARNRAPQPQEIAFFRRRPAVYLRCRSG